MYNVVIYSSNGKAEFSAAIMILILYNLFILSPNPKTNPYTYTHKYTMMLLFLVASPTLIEWFSWAPCSWFLKQKLINRINQQSEFVFFSEILYVIVHKVFFSL